MKSSKFLILVMRTIEVKQLAQSPIKLPMPHINIIMYFKDLDNLLDNLFRYFLKHSSINLGEELTIWKIFK